MALLAAPLLVLVAACSSPLGRDLPECEEVGNAIVISVQAVQGTEFVPCIHSLKTGWDYEHLQARSGGSVFWLDSDRMGSRFLAVTLAPSCDTSGASEVPSDEEGAPLLMDISDRPSPVRITIVPEGRSVQAFGYAQDLERELVDDELVADREVEIAVDSSRAETADRISRARAQGHFVLVVSARDAEEGTLTLLVPGSTVEHSGISLDDAAEVVEELIEPIRYRGFWYYPFVNGCVTYQFNAEGPGVETIETDVQESLGLFAAEPLRQFARDLGFDVP